MPHYINKLDVNKNVDEALLDNLFLQKMYSLKFSTSYNPHLLKSIFQTRFTILKTFSEGVSLPAVTQIYKKFGVFFYYESEKKVL